MNDEDQETRAGPLPAGLIAGLPTGAKLLLILSIALAPFALIAVFAALQTTRNADLAQRAELRVAAGESARTLAIELLGDMNALRTSLEALEADPGNTPSCARARGVFASSVARGVRFAIVDRNGTIRCGSPVPGTATARVDGDINAQIIPDQGLLLSLSGSGGQARASAYFPAAFLDEVGQPSGIDEPYGALLRHDGTTLDLRALEGAALARRDEVKAQIGIDDIRLQMTIKAAPITSPVLVAMLLPILMWAAAAGIAWFVVDRLLIRPLRRLQTSVGLFVPGTLFDPAAIGTMPAQEIRDLGEAVRGLSQTIRAHEGDLAEGLVRQTKLTREVHHRVKNNLQVIASLINFHARSATIPAVSAAYASIQRRVDALAVVHRNHFAELEVNRGLGLRSVIGELAANIRATAPEGSSHLGITLEVEPFLATQDTAVAIAFIITEIVELAMSTHPAAQLRISVKSGDTPDRAMLRVSSPALVDSEMLKTLLVERYGRVIEGLSRQLRAKLHHDPLVGAFEISIAVTGRD